MPDHKYRNILYISLLLLFNARDCWMEQADFFYWLQNTVPFVIVIPISLFIDKIPAKYKFKIKAIVYLFFAAGCFLLSGKDGLTGATFIYLFCFCWGYRPLVMISIVFFCAIIVFRFDSIGITNSETIKYLIGCVFVIDELFCLTWPRKAIIIRSDFLRETQKEVLLLMVDDKSPEEMASELHISTDAVNKRIATLKERFQCKTTYGLVKKAIDEGIIRL